VSSPSAGNESMRSTTSDLRGAIRIGWLILVGVVVVLSGLAIYKPVQLYWITAAFGGYDVARVVHLSCLVLLAVFTVMHLVLVALHPRTIITMVTGGPRG